MIIIMKYINVAIVILLAILVIYVVVSSIFFWAYILKISVPTMFLNVVGDLGTWVGAILAFVSVLILYKNLQEQKQEWKRLRKDRSFDVFNDRLWHQITALTEAESKFQIECKYIGNNNLPQHYCANGNEAFLCLCNDYEKIKNCLSLKSFPEKYSDDLHELLYNEIEELYTESFLNSSNPLMEQDENVTKNINEDKKKLLDSFYAHIYNIKQSEWEKYKYVSDEDKRNIEIEILLRRHLKEVWVYLRTIICICRNCSQFCDDNNFTEKERKEIKTLILPLLSQDEVKFLRIVSPKYTDLKFLFE